MTGGATPDIKACLRWWYKSKKLIAVWLYNLKAALMLTTISTFQTMFLQTFVVLCHILHIKTGEKKKKVSRKLIFNPKAGFKKKKKEERNKQQHKRTSK